LKGGRLIFVFAKKFSKSILKEIGLFFVPNLVVERMVFCFASLAARLTKAVKNRGLIFFLVGGVLERFFFYFDFSF
jgi:hypothetical protein